MAEVFVIFRVVQGNGYMGKSLVKTVISETAAKDAVQELDLQLRMLFSADLVHFVGKGKAESLGMKVGNLMESIGIIGIGHSYVKSETESEIVIPKSIILQPV